ncbi:unnamed protein product, partial [Closterium sp. Naga37s-1]
AVTQQKRRKLQQRQQGLQQLEDPSPHQESVEKARMWRLAAVPQGGVLEGQHGKLGGRV